MLPEEREGWCSDGNGQVAGAGIIGYAKGASLQEGRQVPNALGLRLDDSGLQTCTDRCDNLIVLGTPAKEDANICCAL